ncbi:MAG: hypothetical protein PHW10_00360 [Candidatus Peribacteraceae bacterium]|nr:hypothetical protein [Candidatus Peribacteraceae bacterium]
MRSMSMSNAITTDDSVAVATYFETPSPSTGSSSAGATRVFAVRHGLEQLTWWKRGA